VERCIPDSARSSDDELLRARILVSVTASLFFGSALLHFVVPLILPLSEQGAPLAGLMTLGVVAGTLLGLGAFWISGSRQLSANLLVLWLWAILFGACFRLGGIESPTLALLIMLPVVGTLTCGRIAGSVWAAIAIASWAALLLFDRAGHVFPQIVVPENYKTAQVIILGVMCLFVAAVIFLYESINQNLHRTVARERAELDHLASHDSLTQLANRRTLSIQLDRGIQRASRAGVTLALLIVDLDGFKPVNDRFGHRAGDLLLQELARRLRERVRATDCVARIGGDEFAVVFEHVKRVDDVEVVARELIEAICVPIEFHGQSISVGASVGAALYPDHATDPVVLQEIADAAMYRGKKLPGGFAMADSTLDLPRAV